MIILFWWGYRINVKLVTIRSERVKPKASIYDRLPAYQSGHSSARYQALAWLSERLETSCPGWPWECYLWGKESAQSRATNPFRKITRLASGQWTRAFSAACISLSVYKNAHDMIIRSEKWSRRTDFDDRNKTCWRVYHFTGVCFPCQLCYKQNI